MRARGLAKTNLHLAVLPRRADGFHDLVTLFASVDVADEVEICGSGRAGLEIEVDPSLSFLEDEGGPLCVGPDNLVLRAQEAYREAVARRGRAQPPGRRLKLTKRIPWQAGLGGGSADAGATLRLLNALDGYPLDEAALQACALGLGSDVPFCLVGGLALGEGRGERLTSLPAPPPLGVVLLRPRGGVATALAYRELDREREEEKEEKKEEKREKKEGKICEAAEPLRLAHDMRLAVAAGRLGECRGANDFQDVVERALPDVGRCRRALVEAGASWACLSGSGSAVVGLVGSLEEAETVLSAARKRAAAVCVWGAAATLAPRGVDLLDRG